MILTEDFLDQNFKSQKKTDRERIETIDKIEHKNLRLLHCFYDFSYEVGHNCDSYLPNKKNYFLRIAFIRIHEHSLKIYKECLLLIENGSASGAMARWRTLFEFMIVALFLEKNPSCSEAYIDFAAIGDYKVARKLKKFKDNLQLAHFDQTTFDLIEKNYKDIVLKYKLKDPINDYAWAKCNDFTKKTDLFNLCEYLNLEHLYAYVDESHQYNHPSPKSILYDRGARDDEGERYLFSPFGLSLPIQLIGIALYHINRVILTEYSKISAENTEQIQSYFIINKEFIDGLIQEQQNSTKEPSNAQH